MKALLLKQWGGNYAGQVLTGVQKGSIPSDVARFYEDDEPTPNDVVKDPHPGPAPLSVTNGEMDPSQVDAASKVQADKVSAAKKATAPQADTAAEEAATQRRAKEADQFAAKQATSKNPKKAAGSKLEPGKEHGVK